MPFLVAMLAALLAAVPVALILDTATALAVAAALTITLWPLMALSRRIVVWLADAIGAAFTARRGRG